MKTPSETTQDTPTDDLAADLDLESAIEHFLHRLRSGQPPAIEAFANQFPKIAGTLRQLLPTLVACESVAAEAVAPPAGPASETVPSTIGPYRILRRIGAGGWASCSRRSTIKCSVALP